ncbi:MAG: DUF4097 family beta strand repeat-containing protein [Bacteroidota bacterium]
MKKRMYSLKRLLLMLPIVVVSLTLNAQDAVKTYTETFDVKEGVTLMSDTKYSDIELLTWEKDVVDIVVEIEVEASSKAKAEEKMEKINVRIGEAGNSINLETDFEDGWSRNAKVKIHIIVKAPAYLNLNMESSYGDLFIQELAGLILLELRYGNLKAGSLSRGNEKPFNRLELAYSDGTIEHVGWMELELAYSDLEIGTSGMLFAESKYSKLMGEKAGGIITEGAYDKYYFDEVDHMVAELRYSGIKFGALNKKLVVESKYTNIKVMNVSKEFKEISAVSSYGNIYLDVEQGTSFKFEGEARNGKINLTPEGRLSQMKEGNYKKVWGSVGSSPKATIKLETRYGNIDIE